MQLAKFYLSTSKALILDIDHPLTFEVSKLRQIEAHALIYLSSPCLIPSPQAVVHMFYTDRIPNVVLLELFASGCVNH